MEFLLDKPDSLQVDEIAELIQEGSHTLGVGLMKMEDMPLILRYEELRFLPSLYKPLMKGNPSYKISIPASNSHKTARGQCRICQ